MPQDVGPAPRPGSGVSVVFGPAETLVHLTGDADFCLLEELEQAAHDAICRGEPVTIDVSAVMFMDSTGLAIAEIAAAEDRRRPIVIGASPLVRELLQAANLAELVTVKP